MVIANEFELGQWSVEIDATTLEGDRIYCLESQFDLQCPPEHDGQECFRNVSDALEIDWMVRKRIFDDL